MLVSPDDILLSSASIAENQASGSVVGAFTFADADPGDSFTYALVSGDGDNNNGSFTIQGSELRTATSFDYEATRALFIRAHATDHAGHAVERAFTVSITDVNEAPTLVTLSKASIVEGNAIGAVVGTLSTTDPDAGDTFTYALVSGEGDADNATFTIGGGEVRAAATFDYESRSSYSIRVRSTDQHGLATEKTFSIRIGQDFSGQDLTATYLAGRDLVGASFAGAKLRWANLYGAWLREANLTNADLTGADLTCANLTDAILDGVTFEGATYSNTTWPAGFDPTNKGMWGPGSQHSGIDLPGGIFAGRDFSGSKLDHANLIWANFYGTNLQDVDFTDTNLTGSRFDHANLAGAVLTGAVLTGSSYSSGTTWPAGFDPTTKGMWGPGGIYSGRDLRNASLIWRDLIGARFDRADLRWTNFWGADLRNVDFTDADLSGAQLEFANLTDSVLTGATLAGATYSPSTRWPAGFDPTAHGMWGPGGDYTGVNATGANLAWRYLNGAKFIRANLTGVNFQGTTLVGVDFTDANLTGANLDTSFPGVTYSKNTIWPAGFDPVAAGAILVEAPTDIVLSRSSITENNDVGAVIGSLSSVDPDAGDTFTYALVSGDGDADNASFTIGGGELLAAASFDYETRSIYSIRVRSTDQHGLATEKALTIRIEDVIDTPTMRRNGSALVALASTYGSASAAAETAVEGMLLTGNITATAPAGFQVSSDKLSWGTTAVFTVTAGAFSGTLGIRLSGTARAGSYAGGVTLAGGGALELTVDIPSSVISRKALSITGLTPIDKTYDGTTKVTVLGTPNLAGVVGSDAVGLSGTVAWAFPATDVGSANLQRIGAYTLVNDPHGNYSLVQPSLTASITRRPVAVTGVTASNRVYDGTAIVAVVGGKLGPVSGMPSSGILAADAEAVRPFAVNATATMADKNVGTRKPVTVRGLALEGAKASNYAITTVNVPVITITKVVLIVERLVIDPKIYDGTVTAAANLFHPDSALLMGVCGTDEVVLKSIVGSYARATCGNDVPLAVSFATSGADAGNYSVAKADVIGTILPRPLSVGGLATANRVYDGTANAVLMGKPRYVGLAPIDAVRLAVPVLNGVPTASFIDRNVGNAKTVVVTGYAAPSDNYVLAPVTLSANITPRPLMVVGAKTTARPYDGTTRIVVSAGSLVIGGVLGADSVVLDSQSATGTTTDKNAGTNKTVTVAGYAITGADAPNYALRQPTGLRVTISAKPVQVIGLTAFGKEYDATTVARVTGTATLDPTAIVAGDALEILGSGTYRFASAGVGTDKPIMATGFALGGLDASNYTIRQPGGLAATITRATLTVTGPALVLVRDAQGAVAVPVLTATISGLKGPDTAAVVWTGRAALSTTATAKSPDGTYVITVRQGTLSLKSGNYVWRFVDGAITIR